MRRAVTLARYSDYATGMPRTVALASLVPGIPVPDDALRPTLAVRSLPFSAQFLGRQVAIEEILQRGAVVQVDAGLHTA